MARYQNIFSQTQIRMPVHAGVPLHSAAVDRSASSGFSYWMGKLGDAQIGPIHLGWTGIFSIAFGIIAIEIIGLNMWASVNLDPI